MTSEVWYCPNCGDPMEVVSLKGGGRIGWFCYPCETMHAEEGLNINLGSVDKIKSEDSKQKGGEE